MKAYLNILRRSPLFAGIEPADLESILGCLGAKTVRCRRDEILLLAGDKPGSIGLVLEGRLHIVRDDYDGNRTLVAVLDPGDIFAEALCCAGVALSPVTVAAGDSGAVMLLDFPRLLRTCPSSCDFHAKLIENMLRLIAQKNLYLQSRMEILSLKSVRAKVLHYLGTLAEGRGASVTVPLNREEMADYLGVDRSALSHELMKMKRDGLVEYHKNQFKLL